MSDVHLILTKPNTLNKAQIITFLKYFAKSLYCNVELNGDKESPCLSSFSIENYGVGKPFTRIETLAIKTHYPLK
jgi:hypothetical protein